MRDMMINYVVADDWQGLYVNGILKFQSHDIYVGFLLEVVKQEVADCDGINDFDYKVLHINQEWMEDQGSLPLNMSDIPEDVIIK